MPLKLQNQNNWKSTIQKELQNQLISCLSVKISLEIPHQSHLYCHLPYFILYTYSLNQEPAKLAHLLQGWQKSVGKLSNEFSYLIFKAKAL